MDLRPRTNKPKASGKSGRGSSSSDMNPLSPNLTVGLSPSSNAIVSQTLTSDLPVTGMSRSGLPVSGSSSSAPSNTSSKQDTTRKRSQPPPFASSSSPLEMDTFAHMFAASNALRDNSFTHLNLMELTGTSGLAFDANFLVGIDEFLFIASTLFEKYDAGELPSNDNIDWIVANCHICRATDCTTRGTAVLLSALAFDDLAELLPPLLVDRVADNASRAVLGLEHGGMVIAEVVEWLEKENALRLVVRSASIDIDEAITTVGAGFFVECQPAQCLTVIYAKALPAMSVAKLFEHSLSSGKRRREDELPGASSGEPRFNLDGLPVTIPGKGWQQRLYLLQHLERMMIPQTFLALFPGWNYDIQRVCEVSVSASTSSGNSSWISVPATKLFEQAEYVSSFPVVKQRLLFEDFVLGKWPLRSLSSLSLFSFRWPEDSDAPFGQGCSEQDKIRMAGWLKNFNKVLACYYNAEFNRKLDGVCDLLTDHSATCASWGSEFLFCRIHQTIGSWFVQLRTHSPPDGVSFRLLGAIEFLERSLMSCLTATNDPVLVYPHFSWYHSDRGRGSWSLSTLPSTSGPSLPRPSPAGLDVAPPSTSSTSSAVSRLSLPRSSNSGPSLPSSVPSSGLCVYHLAGLYQVPDSSGRPLLCNRSSCRMDHPPSYSGVPLDQIRTALLNSNARPQVKAAVAERAGVSL